MKGVSAPTPIVLKGQLYYTQMYEKIMFTVVTMNN